MKRAATLIVLVALTALAGSIAPPDNLDSAFEVPLDLEGINYIRRVLPGQASAGVVQTDQQPELLTTDFNDLRAQFSEWNERVRRATPGVRSAPSGVTGTSLNQALGIPNTSVVETKTTVATLYAQADPAGAVVVVMIAYQQFGSQLSAFGADPTPAFFLIGDTSGYLALGRRAKIRLLVGKKHVVWSSTAGGFHGLDEQTGAMTISLPSELLSRVLGGSNGPAAIEINGTRYIFGPFSQKLLRASLELM